MTDIDLSDVLIFSKAPYHQIGGYPYFTPIDLHRSGVYPDLDTRLVRLDTQLAKERGSKGLVLWGCNIGITPEDLKNLDLARVGVITGTVADRR